MTLQDELSTILEQWLTSRKNASLNLLSKLSGVSYTTVLRVAQKEVEPSFKVVALLLPVLLPKEKFGDKASKFIVKHFPEAGYFVKTNDDAEYEPLEELGKLESFLRNDFVALSLSATSQGLTHDRAKEKLGDKADATIQKLLSAGVIFEDDGVYRASKRRFKLTSTDKVLTEISWLTELYDYELHEAWGSFYRLRSEGLSEVGVKKIHQILREADDKMVEVLDNPEHHGANVMGYGIVSTYLDAPTGGVK